MATVRRRTCKRLAAKGRAKVQSTDFSGIVSPVITAADVRLGHAAGGKARKAPQLSRAQPHVIVVMPHPVLGALALALLHQKAKSRKGASEGALSQMAPRRGFAAGGNAGTSTAYGAAPANLGVLAGQSSGGNGITDSLGGMPNSQTIGNATGINPMAISAGEMIGGLVVPPLGMALSAMNAVGNISNTISNSNMLGRMGDDVTLSQTIGGLLGSGLAGTPTQAMNAAMATPNGRLALSTPQAQGELSDVSMPTQTAPTTAVTAESLSGNQSGSGGQGVSGISGGGIGQSNGGGGEYAHGGPVARRRPQGALHRMAQQRSARR
jgi:hypothetical protein